MVCNLLAQVRVVEVDGEPWWVAKDVCDVLGIAQPVRAVQGLDDDEVTTTHVTDSLGRNQQTYIINEPGLYSLILRSRKPQARWSYPAVAAICARRDAP